MPSQVGEDVLIGMAHSGDYVGLPLIYTQEKVYPYDIIAALRTYRHSAFCRLVESLGAARGRTSVEK